VKQAQKHNDCDAPRSDGLNYESKVKTTKGKKVGARSLARSTLEVKGCAGASGWD